MAAEQVQRRYLSRFFVWRTSRNPLSRLPFSRTLLIVAAFFTLPALANIDTTPSVIGSAIPLEQATDLKAQPLALLAKFPSAGPAMARFVANLVARDPSVADAVLSVMGTTSPEQASAIGAGLVRSTRAIEGKQPQFARALREKIMKSDNVWLKTTFAALGPSYFASASFVSPSALPPPPLSSAEVGTVSTEKTHIGASKQNLLGPPPVPTRARDTAPVSEDSEALAEYGTLVAIVVSDAVRNSAVSTSPTQ